MARDPHRFRLQRAGVLNVWQYDEQVFDFADGRLLLRGTNGAGKSKTLELLLPFALDGDRARMAATGRQGSQLMWLMTDGATTGGTRTGYVWVELGRTDAAGDRHVVTCGLGIRYSASAKTVTTWPFTVPAAVPPLCESDGTPLSAGRLRERVGELGGQVFDSPRAYKEHVGRLLFGLAPHAYDDLLRLLYWLRQPQVGEDLAPRRLVEMLDEALPALDDAAVRSVGEAFDELAEHGERVERLRAAAKALADSEQVYARYAATVVVERAGAAREAERERAARTRAVGAATSARDEVAGELAAAGQRQSAAGQAVATAASRVAVLEAGPLARTQQMLAEKKRRAGALAGAAATASRIAQQARLRAEGSAARSAGDEAALADSGRRLSASAGDAGSRLGQCALPAALPEVADVVELAARSRTDVPPIRAQVSAARAAVGVVREALSVVEQRTRVRDTAAERLRGRAARGAGFRPSR